MTELVIISAADDQALMAEMRRVVGYIDRVPSVSLLDVAYTCSQRKGEAVIALVAADISELRGRLVSAIDRLASGTMARLRDKSGTYYFREHLLGEGKGKLAFVYPGVMSFYPDMLRDLAVQLPECRGAFDELEEALVGEVNFTPSSFIFPPADYYRHDADIFHSGAYAEALVSTYSAGVALTRVLAEVGVRANGVVGFAGGDLASMMLSGAAGERLPRPERVKMIREIYQIVSKAVNHGGLEEVVVLTVLMRHPGELESVVAAFPPQKVVLSVDFSPRQKTFVVAKDFEAQAMTAFAEAGARVMKLDFDRPFNTDKCESLVPKIRQFATTWMKHNPTIDVYSCATAGKVADNLKAAREDLSGRWACPARFEGTIRGMYDEGYRVFLEVGPRGLMTTAIADTLKGVDHAAIAMNSIHRRGLHQLKQALGQLVALGADVNITRLLERRHPRLLDFDSSLAPEVRKDSERKLSRAFPKLTILSSDNLLGGAAVAGSSGGRGTRAAARAAAIAQQARRQRQFDFGAMNPLISDADTIASSPAISVEIVKTFRLSEAPFFGDYAFGTSQMSYSDPNLRGLVPLSISAGAELMAEVASKVVPNRTLLRMENLICRRLVAFERGSLRLFVRAERIASAVPEEAVVKVQVRDDAPNSAYTWPVMEAVFVHGANQPESGPVAIEPLLKPRSVHWSGRDIYPARLCCGSRLRGIHLVESWSETGLDYEIGVPSLSGNVAFTRFPLWIIDPLLLEVIADGFQLWRSHERFRGAFSFPFRLRRLVLNGVRPKDGARLKCYMRLMGVTPKSHYCDITATDGNGKLVMQLLGWEELTERVPMGYRELIMQPATTFLSEKLGWDTIGNPAAQVATAFLTDIPYPVFERNGELWLKTISNVVLDAEERREFLEMTGSVSRRTEWLFGRLAAKESVRRFLKDYYQARWSDADVRIWKNDLGKPIALGEWNDLLPVKLDIAIAHTAQFVVAITAANARVGVDVEALSRDLSEEFANGVFTMDELQIAAKTASASQSAIKFWCAKEAVSKAFGTGIRYSPKEMVVVAFDSDTGALNLRLEGAWAEAFKKFKGRDISVTVRTLRDHALASCFIPMALFDENI